MNSGRKNQVRQVLFALSLILIFSSFAWMKSNRRKTNPHDSTAPSSALAQPNGKQDSSSTSLTVSPNTALKKGAMPRKSVQGLQVMTKTLAEFSKPESHVKDLVQMLQFQDQAPVVTRNQNPDTGEMLIVRTQNPVEGTRYFHAQYFSDESGKGFVQHMSFEFQPGSEAMKLATEAVEKSFPQLGSPQIRREDFISWVLDENHILWIKQLSAKDLEEDPFNAYSPADVGTVRVAVEMEIHGGSDHHH